MATEFDFDELDKAVNSLMKDAEPTSGTPAPATEDPVVPAAAEAESVTPPDLANESEVVSPVASPTPPAPAPKSSGRFMDVVHPSSDMRAPTQAVSKEGVPLAPVSSLLNAPQNNQPAPEENPADTLVETASSQLPPAPISSPFLPDAQVEKRPLGGVPTGNSSLDEAIAAELSANVEPPTTEMSETSPAADDSGIPPAAETETDTSTSTESTEAPTEETTLSKEENALPEELSNDLVAIESGNVEAIDGSSEEQPAVEAVEENSDEQSDSISSEPIPASALLSQSIPQQYKEEVSTTSEVHAPIYDDQTTTQPIAQVAKNGHKLRIILIAVGAVVLGIAGAVGLYFVQFKR